MTPAPTNTPASTPSAGIELPPPASPPSETPSSPLKPADAVQTVEPQTKAPEQPAPGGNGKTPEAAKTPEAYTETRTYLEGVQKELQALRDTRQKGEKGLDPRDDTQFTADTTLENERIKAALDDLKQGRPERAQKLMKAYCQIEVSQANLFQEVVSQETQAKPAQTEQEVVDQVAELQEVTTQQETQARQLQTIQKSLQELGVTTEDISAIEQISQRTPQEQITEGLRVQREVLGRGNLAEIAQRIVNPQTPEDKELRQQMIDQVSQRISEVEAELTQLEAQATGKTVEPVQASRKTAGGETVESVKVKQQGTAQEEPSDEEEKKPLTPKEKALKALKMGGTIMGLLGLIVIFSGLKEG